MDSGSARRVEFALLGPVRAWRGGRELDLGPVKQQAVLARLVLRPEVTVSQQELLDGVWGPAAAGMGRSVVPGYVHRLRACLQGSGSGSSSAPGADGSGGGAPDGVMGSVMDSVIRSDRSGYRFARESADVDVDVDVARLDATAAVARRAKETLDLAAAVDAYRSALDLYRGEPLSGLPGPFAEAERARLVQHRLALTQETLECQIWQGLYTAAVGELSALCAMHPHDESFAALLMRALYGCGRQAEALDVFMSMRVRLVEDLAVEPGDELSRIQQAVLRRDDAVLIHPSASGHSAGGLASSGSALGLTASPTSDSIQPVRRSRNDLPADVGELVGRAAQIAQLTSVDDSVAVWLGVVDGVAGVGKTAMAVRAAWSMRERFPDGCLFVDLHGHSHGREPLTPQRALRRLLRSVGADDVDDVDDLDELAASWRSATSALRLLLMLDDASGAGQVRPLLPTGSGSTVLVTSRRRLTGLDADCRISLQPLDIDDAVALLRRIVGEMRTDQEPDATRELARLCDGLPLALRIAGARLQNRSSWTLGHFVSRLIDDERRIGELAAEDRSVEAAFQLSYDQLSETQRRAFRVVGLSPTVEFDQVALAAMLGWAPQDAESVLESLVDASLVQQPAVGRYRMHDLVAAHARRMSVVDSTEAVIAQTAVLRLYIAAARYASDWGPAGFPTGPNVVGASPFTGWRDATAWLDAASGELVDVVRHALAAGRIDEACWIAEGLVDYFVRQGQYRECRTALEAVLAHVDKAADRRMTSSLRTCLAIAYAVQGHHQQARFWLTESLEISRASGDRREYARALGVLGTVDRMVGRTTEATDHLTEVMRLIEQVNDDWLAGMSTFNLGIIHHQAGRHDEALDCLAQSLARAKVIDRPRPLAKTLCYCGDVRTDLGQYAEAGALLRHAAATAQEAGDIPLHTLCLTKLGTVEQHLGNPQSAIGLHNQALAALGEQAGPELEAEIRNRLGASHAAAGELTEAREQYQTVLTLVGPDDNPDEHARALDGLSRCG
jgi:DNA-binding SARP family transcriptional activator/tetratricopeptide (TPR) repeat protein